MFQHVKKLTITNIYINKNMRKNIFIMAFGLMSLSAMADNVPGVVVTKTDGSTIQVPISATRSIKFADGNMIINKTDNTKQTVSLDDVELVTFSSISAAIKTIAGDSNKQMIVTDLSGRVVYKGDSQSNNIPTSLHGVYIITVDGQSHKISIP